MKYFEKLCYFEIPYLMIKYGSYPQLSVIYLDSLAIALVTVFVTDRANFAALEPSKCFSFLHQYILE